MVRPVKVVVNSELLGTLTRPAGWGQDAVLGPVGPFWTQLPAGALDWGAPMLVASTPDEAVESLEAMVLFIRFTTSESCKDKPAPSQPATLLEMMLLVMLTEYHFAGSPGKVDTSVPLT